MSWLEAFILGLIQALTEFLPISSSGHVELAKAAMGVQTEKNLLFQIAIHVGTSISTVIVYRKDIGGLVRGVFTPKMNDEKKYALLILLSMIPLFVVGTLYNDPLEALFEGNALLVGIALLFTAGLLVFTKVVPEGKSEVTPRSAILIGLAQAIAIVPGISRSGMTIAAALYLKIDRTKAARFSFLMIIPPILGKGLLDTLKIVKEGEAGNQELMPLLIGLVVSMVLGVFMCRWMIRLVQRGGVYWFGFYCLVLGLVAVAWALLTSS